LENQDNRHTAGVKENKQQLGITLFLRKSVATCTAGGMATENKRRTRTARDKTPNGGY